ncbi:protein phosphatase 2C domain-containing protein [Roseburia hominis]
MKIFRFIRKGTIHQEKGVQCQDTAEYFMQSDDMVVLALSDGASQAQYAKMASECNVRAVIELFQQIALEEFMKFSKEEQKQKVLSQCIYYIGEQARRVGCRDLRHFSATLVFVVINSRFILTGHIGDGAIYMADVAGKICFVSGPENKLSSQQTFFTVSGDAYEHFYIKIVDRKEQNPAMAVLMSDGPQLMFKDRGFGNPEETVKELLPFLVNGLVEDDVDFGRLLDQMTELEVEKLDDWSILAVLLSPEIYAEEVSAQESRTNTIFIPRKYYQGKEGRLASAEIVEQIVWRMSPGYYVYGKGRNREHVYEYYLQGVEQQAVAKVILVRDLVKRSVDRSINMEGRYKAEVARMRGVLHALKRMGDCPNIVDIYADCEVVMEESGEVKMFLVIEKRYSVIRTFIEKRPIFAKRRREKYVTLADYMRSEMRTEYLYMELLARKVAQDILNALLVLEEVHILHGNIREDNIMMDCIAGSPCFVLSGFEGARELNQENAGFDLYCLGNVLYRMLSETKELPYSLWGWGKVKRSFQTTEFGKIILKARSHYKGNGYRQAADMLNDINALE